MEEWRFRAICRAFRLQDNSSTVLDDSFWSGRFGELYFTYNKEFLMQYPQEALKNICEELQRKLDEILSAKTEQDLFGEVYDDQTKN